MMDTPITPSVCDMDIVDLAMNIVLGANMTSAQWERVWTLAREKMNEKRNEMRNEDRQGSQDRAELNHEPEVTEGNQNINSESDGVTIESLLETNNEVIHDDVNFAELERLGLDRSNLYGISTYYDYVNGWSTDTSSLSDDSVDYFSQSINSTDLSSSSATTAESSEAPWDVSDILDKYFQDAN